MEGTKLVFFILFIDITIIAAKESSIFPRSAFFTVKEDKRLKGRVFKRFDSVSFMSCSLRCFRNKCCTSTNFKVRSSVNVKGKCELFNREVSHNSDNTGQFQDQKGATFSLLLKVNCQLLANFLIESQNKVPLFLGK